MSCKNNFRISLEKKFILSTHLKFFFEGRKDDGRPVA